MSYLDSYVYSAQWLVYIQNIQNYVGKCKKTPLKNNKKYKSAKQLPGFTFGMFPFSDEFQSIKLYLAQISHLNLEFSRNTDVRCFLRCWDVYFFLSLFLHKIKVKELARARLASLEGAKKVHAFVRDADDAIEWMDEKSLLACSEEYGQDIQSVNTLIVKHKALEVCGRTEIPYTTVARATIRMNYWCK